MLFLTFNTIYKSIYSKITWEVQLTKVLTQSNKPFTRSMLANMARIHKAAII